jgi:putative transposase
MRDFKKYTAAKILQEIKQSQPEQLETLLYQQYSQKFKVWQDRFDEVYLESKTLLEVKLDYIHNNPIQSHWNLAKKPSDYSYSSAMFYEKGMQNNILVEHYMDFV